MDQILANQHGGKANVDHALLTQLAKIGKFKSLLDVGCGPGQNVDCATALGFDLWGVEPICATKQAKFRTCGLQIRCALAQPY